MKKQLLTTTALVAAGVLTVSGAALADKPKLTVGGSTEQIIGIGANDDAFDAINGQHLLHIQSSTDCADKNNTEEKDGKLRTQLFFLLCSSNRQQVNTNHLSPTFLIANPVATENMGPIALR